MDLILISSSIAGLLLIGAGAAWFKKRSPRATVLGESDLTGEKPLEPTTQPASRTPSDLGDKLQKTRGSLFDRLSQLCGVRGPGDLADNDWDSVEEVLLEADVGLSTTQQIIRAAKDLKSQNKDQEIKCVIHEVSSDLFRALEHGRLKSVGQPKPLVISVVGINGAGKTTTIGKLTQQLKTEGKTVLLGAVDTFRAGAISQLKVWADRTGAQFVTGREGADPGAVAFDAVTAGKARGVDIVILDTAGRLHTKANLMEELKKVHRVVKKVIPEAPHETWLVIDGTLGQNSVIQAKEFQKSLDVTGVIVTKLDGTAKGGAVLSIASELKLPIRYIGVGESVEDLTPFEPRAFLNAILG